MYSIEADVRIEAIQKLYNSNHKIIGYIICIDSSNGDSRKLAIMYNKMTEQLNDLQFVLNSILSDKDLFDLKLKVLGVKDAITSYNQLRLRYCGNTLTHSAFDIVNRQFNGGMDTNEPQLKCCKDTAKFNRTLKLIDFEYLYSSHMYKKISSLSMYDLSYIKSMKAAFNSIGNVRDLDLGDHPESVNLVDTSYMFYNSTGISNVDISKLNTSSVKTMESMFEYCTLVESISFGDTSRVENFEKAFLKCLCLRDINNLNTHSAKTMRSMFRGGKVGIDTLEQLDTSSCEYMSAMFYSTTIIARNNTLDLRNFNVDKVKDFTAMFRNLTFIHYVNVLDISTWNISPDATIKDMFISIDIKHIFVNSRTYNLLMDRLQESGIDSDTSKLVIK